jgi:glycosyltransferase involved in cell wall biosynthesis
LERSLTVLLPVQDAQSTLADTVVHVLEVASDLTDRFELLIIDDGSSDATSEIAYELSRHYPQVRAVRHAKPMGRAAALRTGMAQCHGEVACAGEGSHPTIERLDRLSKFGRPNFLDRSKHAAWDEA